MQTTLLQDILQLLLKIILVIIAFILLFTFLFGVFWVQDAAMVPAVHDGDLVIFYRIDKDYVANDAIVMEYQGERQVRRVVAVTGDTVDITEAGLLINGNLVQEQNIYQETLPYLEGITYPVTVGEQQVFVLGDNRENSVDSRIYGLVEIRDTLGKVMTVIRRRNI